MKTVGFYLDSFTYRGTTTAIYDYAYYNMVLLANQSIIICLKDVYDAAMEKTENKQIEKEKLVAYQFEKQFGILKIQTEQDLIEQCDFLKIKLDAIYTIRHGKKGVNTIKFRDNESLIFNKFPTLIHCVFHMTPEDVHGSKYVGVSRSVATKMVKQEFEHVDHIVKLPELDKDNCLIGDFRQELKISPNTLVLGRLGGIDTFDIPFVKDVILNVIKSTDVVFLFAVRPDMLKDVNHPRIICMESFFDPVIKRKFINTCNAMIHASSLGESQGLSILEFMYCYKPVITWNGGALHRQHLDNLGNNALIYNNSKELMSIITNYFTPHFIGGQLKESCNKRTMKFDYQSVVSKFSPEIVMKEFNRLFLS